MSVKDSTPFSNLRKMSTKARLMKKLEQKQAQGDQSTQQSVSTSLKGVATKSVTTKAVTKEQVNLNASQLEAKLKSQELHAAANANHYNTQFENKYLKAPLGVYKWKGPSVKDRLALVMMIKNEEKRIEVSYDSVKNICNTFVILDTGSTDRTIEITRAYCKKNNITLHLKELPFVNFEKSRNDLLDFADEALSNHYFMLLLDCNDELRNHDDVTNLVESYSNETQTGFHLRQQWWTGATLDTYYNIRMVISHFAWRYRGVVHEYIARNPGKDNNDDIRMCGEIILFQDRTKDDDKSQKRFKRDKDLLYAEHLRIPDEPRTLFYLAQTCNCLNQMQEAYEYNLLRTKYTGFVEEVYHSYDRLGKIAQRLNHPWEESLGWFLKAYAHSKRAEPLVNIAKYYMENNAFGERVPDWHLAYMFIQQACSLNFPHAQILFIDKNVYVYERWHLMGRIGFYANRFKEGKEGCIKALMAQDTQVDMDNLLHYLRIERQMKDQLRLGTAQIEPLMTVSFDDGDIVLEKEKGLGIGTAFTREDIMMRANKKFR